MVESKRLEKIIDIIMIFYDLMILPRYFELMEVYLTKIMEVI